MLIGKCFIKKTKIPLLRKLLLVLVISLFISSFNVYAQIQKEFSPRFNEVINGDFTMIANNILSRTATQAYNGESDNHNFSDNVYVDIDTDDSTFNSSSANFINPQPQLACLTIKNAYLYWAAADKELDNGEDNQPSWNFNDVKLMLPGENNYQTLTADEIIYRGRDTHFSNDPYVCFKDITNLVTTLDSPYGKYQVANIEAKTGFLFQHSGGNTGASGGWQIIYIYESPELTSKNVSLFDGYAHITSSFNNYDIDFSGFQTVPSGPVNVKMLIGSLEGDRSLIGDKFQIQNTSNNYIDIATSLRNSNNFFNSKITLSDTNFIDRNPPSLNTLGFDAALFQLDNLNNSIIDNNQSSASIRLASDQETYGLFLVGLSVEVWIPNLYPIALNSNVTENNANANETVILHLNFSNTGNDNATNVILSETIPTNVEFVSVNNLPNGVTYTYNINTRHLQFFVEDGLLDIGDLPLNIELELIIKDECYFLEDNCNLSSELQFIATYNGEENIGLFTTNSSNELDDCQLGTPLPITINQPNVLWQTPIGNLNRVLSTNNLNELAEAQMLEPVTNKCNFELIKTSGDFIQNSDCDYSGNYTNTWSFTDACGVPIEDYVQIITVSSNELFDGSNISVSNVVTPNQDQWNEYFTITEIKNCGFIINLKIFNRWGGIIYQSDNYQNNWNGNSNRSIGVSNKVPSGTYYYIINMLNSGLLPITGSFYVGTK